MASTPPKRKCRPQISALRQAGISDTCVAQCGCYCFVKAAHIVFEAPQNKIAAFHPRQTKLDLLTDEQILAVEDLAIYQVERSVPMRLRLVVGRRFRCQHGVNER